MIAFYLILHMLGFPPSPLPEMRKGPLCLRFSAAYMEWDEIGNVDGKGFGWIGGKSGVPFSLLGFPFCARNWDGAAGLCKL